MRSTRREDGSPEHLALHGCVSGVARGQEVTSWGARWPQTPHRVRGCVFLQGAHRDLRPLWSAFLHILSWSSWGLSVWSGSEGRGVPLWGPWALGLDTEWMASSLVTLRKATLIPSGSCRGQLPLSSDGAGGPSPGGHRAYGHSPGQRHSLELSPA